ncbi:hypothetical protein D9M70_461790 [compost metagenome]
MAPSTDENVAWISGVAASSGRSDSSKDLRSGPRSLRGLSLMRRETSLRFSAVARTFSTSGRALIWPTRSSEMRAVSSSRVPGGKMILSCETLLSLVGRKPVGSMVKSPIEPMKISATSDKAVLR